MTERLFETVVRLFLAWRAGPAGAGVYKLLQGEVTDCPLVLGWGWLGLAIGLQRRVAGAAIGQVQIHTYI